MDQYDSPSRKRRRISNESKNDRDDNHFRAHTVSNNDLAKEDNSAVRNKSYSWSGLYGLLFVGICVICSSPILLLPQHNSIISPEYWYEGLINGCLSFPITLTLDTLIALKFYFKIGYMISARFFLRMYFISIIFVCIFYVVYFLIWTVGLGYNPPMPYSLLLGYTQCLAQYMTLVFLLPKPLIEGYEFQKKLRAFTLSRLVALCIDVEYNVCTFLFTFLSSQTQWILAFLLPYLREINFQILNKVLIYMPGVEDEDMRSVIVIGLNTYHAIYVAVKLGHTATQMTSYSILAIDFILNIYSCYRIIRLHRSISPGSLLQSILTAKKKEDYLRRLILIEMLEVLVPITYVVTVLIAYYGPNADVLGNIRNDYWQYESIDNVGSVVLAVLLMFAIDLSSAVLSGIALWKLCSINFLYKTSEVLTAYWEVIAVNLANYLNYVSIIQSHNFMIIKKIYNISLRFAASHNSIIFFSITYH